MSTLTEPLIAARLHRAPPAEALSEMGFEAAAEAVRGGEPLDAVLARMKILSGAYRATLEAEAPEAVEPIADALAELDRQRRALRLQIRAAVVNAASVVIALFTAAHLALPALQAGIVSAGRGEGLPELWVTLHPLYSAEIGVALLVLLGALWRFGDRAWLSSRGGRRALRGAVGQALSALLSAGASLEVALRRVAETCPLAAERLTQAADRLEGGAPVEAALAEAGLVDEAGPGLWPLIVEAPALADALGEVAVIEGRLYAPQRLIWTLYALLVGPLALGFGYLIFTAWVLALPL